MSDFTFTPDNWNNLAEIARRFSDVQYAALVAEPYPNGIERKELLAADIDPPTVRLHLNNVFSAHTDINSLVGLLARLSKSGFMEDIPPDLLSIL